MTERELERLAKHKLAALKHVEEVSGSVSATCRNYGIIRTRYYEWLKGGRDHCAALGRFCRRCRNTFWCLLGQMMAGRAERQRRSAENRSQESPVEWWGLRSNGGAA